MAAKKVPTGPERKAQLLDVGAKLVAKNGAVNITRRMVAQAGKVSEALVSNYFGDRASLQKRMKAHAKKLGLAEPHPAKIDAIGIKLRAHGPRDARDTRKRSAKEVKAIVKKSVSAPAKKTSQAVSTKKPAGSTASAVAKRASAPTVPSQKPAPSSNKAVPAAPSNKLKPLPLPQGQTAPAPQLAPLALPLPPVE
jgi:hypothetical protein